MNSRRLPHLDYLIECFDYNPNDGSFCWKQRPESHFKTSHAWKAWNARTAGRPAFSSLDATGRHVTCLGGRQLFAHRVAYFIGTGEHPDEEIDHINGDPTDNRLSNLRHVNRRTNCLNRSRPRTGTTPHIGVRRWSPNRWGAFITVHGKCLSLGSFEKLEDAIAARKAAEKAHGFHVNHGRNAAEVRRG